MIRFLFIPILIIGLCFTGCENRDETEADNFGEDTLFEDTDLEAVAQLVPMAGSSVMGSITFTSTDDDDDLHIEGEISGLAEGKYGFHIHEGTSCSQPGDHLNPDDAMHGAPDSTSRHLGDLGNVEVDSDSTASVDMTMDRLQLDGMNSIVGHALVIHENEDDLTTQPSGNSGTGLACGIIESSDEEM